MIIYIDLTLLSHILILIIAIKYSFIFFRPKKFKLWTLFLINSLIIIPIIFDRNYLFITISIFILNCYLLFKNQFIRPLILMLTIYYSFGTFFIAIGKGFTFYNGVFAISSPNYLYFLTISPLTLIFVHYSSLLIVRFIKLREFKHDLFISYGEKTIKLRGYLDTGNTLVVDNLPVIFIGEHYWPFDRNNEKMINYYTAASSQTGTVIPAKVNFKIQNKLYIKNILISLVNKKEFNGCECLMNVWLVK